MFDRFLLLKRCIIKASLDLSTAIDTSETEFAFLDDLKTVFDPVKLAVEALCRRDAPLLIAEGISRFLVYEMKKRRSTMANDLFCAIKDRIQQRWQHDVVNLLRYLPNLKVLVEHDHTDVTSWAVMQNKVFWRQLRLWSAACLPTSTDLQQSHDEAEPMESSDNSRKSDSLLERLQAHIDHSTHNRFDISSCDSTNWLRAITACRSYWKKTGQTWATVQCLTEHSTNLSWGGTSFLRCGLVYHQNSFVRSWVINQSVPSVFCEAVTKKWIKNLHALLPVWFCLYRHLHIMLFFPGSQDWARFFPGFPFS